MLTLLQSSLHYLFERTEAAFNLFFDDDWNPFYQLGALSFYFFWILAGTGLYLFVFFETSIDGAYSSLQYLTNEQWYLGGVMRSLHRYCSDALAITVTLHLIREFAMGRFTGKRWFSWFTGIPLLWFMFAAAIGGYWLVWDQFAQYVAVATMEWMDWLPAFGDPLARNFLTNEAVSDRFFSLMVFLHFGIPLFMMVGMFVHISRVSKAKSNPPKGLAIGTIAAFIVLSLIKPAISADPADLSLTQLDIPVDWFFLSAYPFFDILGHGAVWGILVGLSTFLSFLPLIFREKKKPVAVVDPDHCSGCGWCELDCPYDAVVFGEHPNPKYERLAVVLEDKCVSCGICTGSCPTATPFQRVDVLKSGIEIPDFTIEDFKGEIIARLGKLEGEARIIVLGCEKGAAYKTLELDNVITISLPCIGFLPPSFVDYLIRKDHADGVMVTGCCLDNCYNRSGNLWTAERFKGERSPHLRTVAAKDDNKVRVRWAGAMELGALKAEIITFSQSLRSDYVPENTTSERFRSKGKNYYGQALFYAAIISFVGYFSTSPTYTRVAEGDATVKLSMRHTGQIIGECRIMSEEELQRLPPNMRQAKVCPRERSSIEFQFLVDGEEAYHKVVEPAGYKKDGRAKLYHRFTIKAGEHEITARLKDHRDLEDFNYQETQMIDLPSRAVLVVDFDPDTKKFIIIGSRAQ
ncbi:MAG: hypothetical protein DRQ47_04215 [Gammaproteobacteria bacterium]|nr:MAG: hypothetical protein DRQ47_04215 [Gammaproteobacteria bacterium]